MTRLPLLARAHPRLRTVVVLPTPPFGLKNAILAATATPSCAFDYCLQYPLRSLTTKGHPAFSGIVPAQSSALRSSCVPPQAPVLYIHGPLEAKKRQPRPLQS